MATATKSKEQTGLVNQETGEIAVIESEFPVIAQTDLAQELLKENFGRVGIRTQDLDVVKCPSAGMTVWTVPGLKGESHQAKVQGVAAAWRERRAFWPVPFGSGTTGPPACYSLDGVTGVGDPGGPCRPCPYNQFGSAVRQDGTPGRGKACRETLPVFTMLPAQLLPTVIRVSTASMRLVKTYFRQLASNALSPWGAVTEWGLKKARSGDGIEYTQIEPTFLRELEGPQKARMREYSETLNGLIDIDEQRNGAMVAEADVAETAEGGDGYFS